MLQIGCKLFAIVLLQRLKGAGAEQRIWRTQFGFKSNSGTRDALLLARRLIDRAWDQKEGKLIYLALDWAKAFDSISPAALVDALSRFGIPPKMLKTIKAIYTNRTFQVRGAGNTSAPHRQSYGICQGCPLSPFLFVMVMTVLMHDAKALLRTHPAYTAYGEQLIEELLYADDTLLIHSDPEVVRLYMECVREAGSHYGLEFNGKKLENMPVRCDAEFFSPSGDPIQRKGSLKYLGSMLCSSGKTGTELSCRLGAAKSEFDKLRKVWSHASLSRAKKLRIYEACVVSKLLYCLEGLQLNKAELRKLDACHYRCLRQIAGIPPSYTSRVTNQEVLNTLHTKSLTTQLLKRQLTYIGSIAARPAGDACRDILFLPGEIKLRPLDGKRRRGRPRASWAAYLFSIATKIAGNLVTLEQLWGPNGCSRAAWKRAVNNYCSSL